MFDKNTFSEIGINYTSIRKTGKIKNYVSTRDIRKPTGEEAKKCYRTYSIYIVCTCVGNYIP